MRDYKWVNADEYVQICMCEFSASERQLTVLETEGLPLPGKCCRGKQHRKNVCGASLVWPGVCSAGSPPPGWGRQSGLHVFGARSLKRLWMWFSKHTCGRLRTHVKCVLGNFTWMLTSSPGRKMPLDQYLTLYKILPLNDSNTCVFMRSNGGEGSKTESCTFYYMSCCSCNN